MKFPEAKPDAIAAAADFEKRAAAVVTYNACGREIDYANLRRSMKEKDGEGEGEDITAILIAKIQWLSMPETAGMVCRWEHHESFTDTEGRPRYESVQKWVDARYVAWLYPETGCALAKSGTPDITAQAGAWIVIRVEPSCMRAQINEAIRAMVRNKQMGTDGLTCAGTFHFDVDGDWDVNVRELVRILYMGTRGRAPILDDLTVGWMYQELLTASGPVGPDSYSQLADCDMPAGDTTGSPEDRADRHDWGNEFFEALGDFFKWLISFLYKAVASLASSIAGTVIWPILLANGDDPFQLIFPHWDVRITETENHRLMIESSRFLTNAEMIRHLEAKGWDNVDDMKDEQSTVREWLLNALADIARHDFSEYNSKPYSRYSLNAILNLYDFADDQQVKQAAQIVLDLSAAKFAIGSNRGRRIVPFRRLAESDGSKGEPYIELYNREKGPDHEVERAIVLAGQTQLMPQGVDLAGAGDLVWAAVSSYRVPDIIVEAAVDRRATRSQQLRHTGIELYYQSPAFTVTAGGVPTGATITDVGVSRNLDRGVAMPTTLIPTIAGVKLEDVYGFNGFGTQHERTANLCTYKGFLCGFNPNLPGIWEKCISKRMSEADGLYYFVNSALCRLTPGDGSEGPHFYLAIKRGECDGSYCPRGSPWGIMEAVDAPKATAKDDAEFDQWVVSRLKALEGTQPDAGGRGTYRNASGEQIQYLLTTASPGFPLILGVDGHDPNWFLTPLLPRMTAHGDLIETNGDGHITIRSVASGHAIEIDVTDPMTPKRDVR